MSLLDYDFKPDYNKAEDDIAQEFYLPAMKNASVYGDQYVTIEIQVPRNLNPEAKRKLKEYERVA